MFDSPLSLRDYCLDYVRESISCEVEDEPQKQHLDKVKDSWLTGNISEELLTSLSENGQLTDELMQVFVSTTKNLQSVRIPDASRLTNVGLRVLKSHKITELEVGGLTKVTINELIGFLGEWTLMNLKYLNVTHSSFTNSNKFCVVVGLAKLQSLQILNVSHTEFNHHGLEIVVEDLPSLQHLNISSTRVRDLQPLKKMKDRLKSLSMYNLRSSSGGCEEFVPVLCELNQLQYLDISDDRDNPLDMLTPLEDCITQILKRPHCFPRLKSFDISGKEGVESEDVQNFVIYKKKFAEPLTFLGLMQTNVCFDDMFTQESHEHFSADLVVTGNATESQIIESLRRYSNRPAFVQKSLYYLYNYTLSYSEPKVNLIELIVPSMKKNNKVIGIQMAATACLYNLSKGKLGEQIHPKWLKQVVDVTLDAMQNFPHHQQLQKNTLLTLCSDRILQDVNFNRFKCTELVMDSLCEFNDISMNRMAVAICSILAAKISTVETSCLGAKPKYMETLLDIVNSRIDSGSEPDIMLKFTLSALWNLTDESPSTCSMFLEKNGLDLYLEVLHKYVGRSAVETKALGLLNNIAEVPHLRPDLMKDEFLLTLKGLLHSPQIDVSYFAAGIFAHLACDGVDTWKSRALPRHQLLKELGEVVLSWQTPEIEMVAYRSFTPFLPLLNCADAPQVQLWATWAIHHVCSKNPKRYCDMLYDEKGVDAINGVFNNALESTNAPLTEIARETLIVVYSTLPKKKYSDKLFCEKKKKCIFSHGE